jgi:FKBP-type peptidyl-prolyl cis-trans isomerase (trigger factor)
MRSMTADQPRFLALTPDRLRRRFLLVVPRDEVMAQREARLQAIGLGAVAQEAERGRPALARILDSTMAECIEIAARDAVAAMLRSLALASIGPARLEMLASPPDSDLILRAEIPTLPEVAPPDPAALRLERLVVQPSDAEVEAELAALALRRSVWQQPPPGTRATAEDRLVCDVAATLLPAVNHIPQPGLVGARPGRPGQLPEGWTFGDNGAGLVAEVTAIEPAANPPHIRLRVHGTTTQDGQSYVIFHPPGSIASRPDSDWVGSVSLRPVGAPVGLRGCKLRLESQGRDAEGRLRRKDAALLAADGAGFTRCYVSDKFPEAETAFLRMPLLFDHAAGAVDFTCDIGAPRLVEGLDLGEQGPVPLPALSGPSQMLGAGAADRLGLSAHLAGMVPQETRVVTLHLPDSMPDRALAGRQARFTLRAKTVLRRVLPPVDDALAQAAGFAGLDALRAGIAARLADRAARLQQRQLRLAALQALLQAAGEIPLPEEAVSAETAALWPTYAAAAAQRGAVPSREAAATMAGRRLRIGLLVSALAQRHGLTADAAALRAAATALGPGAPEETVRARALEDTVVAFLLAHAQVSDREADTAELMAAAEQ